ncbi:flagellar brake protein [Paenibacillus sp. FJAT-26967]|uniref:flagellar brake protein n=1 Tax=Paenibacillus sp. FJAT-26967 TaxID=1729690 RepID=UPI0008381F75|nr:flagellar brake domain-containing protein [Paenibacillus sp. FJAT-26967]
MAELMKVNQLLHLQVNTIDEEEAKQEYKARISDVRADTILIEVPMNERTGRLKRLYTGDELNAYYVSDGGVKNYFQSSVIGFREQGIKLVAIAKPDPASITKIQRRSFLRIPAELEVSVTSAGHTPFIALTEDVGGGGVSFICGGDEKVEASDHVNCWLVVPYKNGSIEHLNFKAEAVRIKPLESGRKIVMLQFSEIADRDRQKLIQYCFEKQFDLRKN